MDDRNGRPLDERVAALERTVTDGYADDGLPDAARMETRLDDLEATVDGLDERVAELDAAVQALRGFAGGVRAVDEAVERRADAAVARVDRLEDELSDVREQVRGRDETRTVAEPSGHESAAPPRHEADAGTRGDPPRSEPSVAGAQSATGDGGVRSGEDGRARNRDGSLNGDVAARTDAALADAAATGTAADADSADDEKSFADRIRRLL